MGTGYTRNDTANNIADGNVINASDLDGEFDAIQSAFNGTTGHSHDGTTGEGPQIDTGGLADDAVTAAKLDETATFTMAGLSVTGNTTLGDAATDTVTVTADVASNLIPSADGTYNLGASGSEWQDLYIDGTANIDSLVADTADVNGGNIDGTVIGATTAAAGTFTSVTGTSLDINGSADVSGTLSVAAKIDHTGDTDTFFEFSAANTARVVTGNVERLFIDNSGIIINETGADYDFRVEGDTEANLLFVDAGNDRVGIANATPSTALDVTGTVTATAFSGPLTGTASNAALLDNIDSTSFLRSDAADTKTSGDLSFSDSVKAQFGASNDLQIFHNASDSYIKEVGTGDLFIQASTTIRMQDSSSGNNIFVGSGSGAATLYHNNAAKLATKSDGVDITGELQADSLDIDGAADISGLLNMSGGNIRLGDSSGSNVSRLQMGASQDFAIYHDGTHSRISDGGTGDLKIQTNGTGVYLTKNASETMAQFLTDGAVNLYYDNAKKFETTSYGVDISGSVVADTDVNTSAGATPTPNMSAYQNFVWTLTANANLGNPSTEKVGQTGFFVFIQDGTGGRTLSLGSEYKTAGGAGITLSTAASAVDVVPYIVQATGTILLGAPQLAFS